MDYEYKYNELKQKVDEVIMPLLKRALAQISEEDDIIVEKEENYENQIAPNDSDLPTILRMAEPAERQQVIKKVKSLIIDGEWVGVKTHRRKDGGGGRPFVCIATRRSKQHQSQGIRKNKLSLDKRTGRYVLPSPTVTFVVAHALLVDAGFYPTETRNIASHLCHKSDCVNTDHLIWESSSDNNRRERKCRRIGSCSCGLHPPCLINVHTK